MNIRVDLGIHGVHPVEHDERVGHVVGLGRPFQSQECRCVGALPARWSLSKEGHVPREEREELITEPTVRPARGPGAILAASEGSDGSRAHILSVGAAIGQLQQHLHGRGTAVVDPPAVVTLVCVQDPEVGQALNGDLGHRQPVLVDPPRRQGGVGRPEAAADVGREPGSGLWIPAEVHVVLDAGHLTAQQLEAVVDLADVAGKRISRGAVVVDVDLAAGHIEVLVLQFRQLDPGGHLAVLVPVGADAGNARVGHVAVVLEP